MDSRLILPYCGKARRRCRGRDNTMYSYLKIWDGQYLPIIGKKISSGMRSDCGRQCCDTVSSLK